jgi:hypothetical protein
MAPNLTPPGIPSDGQHLTTLSFEGRFWDVYLEFADDPRRADSSRALLCFSPSDRNDGEKVVRTTTIIIESSPQEVLARARALESYQLVGLLRSCLPD